MDPADAIRKTIDQATAAIAGKLRSCAADEKFLAEATALIVANPKITSIGDAATLAMRVAFTQAAIYAEQYAAGCKIQIVTKGRRPA